MSLQPFNAGSSPTGRPSAHRTGHSFRRGAAQHAHDMGLSRDDIKALGRWSSDAVDRYYTANKSHHLYNLQRRFTAPIQQTNKPTTLGCELGGLLSRTGLPTTWGTLSLSHSPGSEAPPGAISRKLVPRRSHHIDSRHQRPSPAPAGPHAAHTANQVVQKPKTSSASVLA
ncbi:hypothetical protein E4U16_004980 [Claviceps sp. LM84 group G4]|nr:hypothetical protein E4U16_004980 [Claviceps sp. LM84 group G4]